MYIVCHPAPERRQRAAPVVGKETAETRPHHHLNTAGPIVHRQNPESMELDDQWRLKTGSGLLNHILRDENIRYWLIDDP